MTERGYSSVVEHSTADREVPGSYPGVPFFCFKNICLLISSIVKGKQCIIHIYVYSCMSIYSIGYFFMQVWSTGSNALFSLYFYESLIIDKELK